MHYMEQDLMHIAILTFVFSLPGCSSLKEKRQRIGGLHERLGRNPSIAVCESSHQNSHDSSEWSFVLVAKSQRELDALCNDTENKIQSSVDARIMDIHREVL